MNAQSLLVRFLVLALCLIGSAHDSSAQEAVDREKMVVGTREVPPFSFKDADGHWTGMSFDVWNRIARDLNLAFEVRDVDLPALLTGLEKGEIDAGVAALTMTAEREQRFDFSHPIHSSGLGIAVNRKHAGAREGLLHRFLSVEFLEIVGILVCLLMGTGLLAWLFERRRNASQFGGKPLRGIASGFWWSAVTMTTVGYGDKAPVTPGGRLVAFFWMFTSVLLVSTFTATVASILTVSQLSTGISSPDDLIGARVATVAGSTSEEYLNRQGIDCSTTSEVGQALRSLAEGELDAVVYDAPVLKYLVNHTITGSVAVLPSTFERQNYAIGFTTGNHPRMELVNRSILRVLASASWERSLKYYIGE